MQKNINIVALHPFKNCKIYLLIHSVSTFSCTGTIKGSESLQGFDNPHQYVCDY